MKKMVIRNEYDLKNALNSAASAINTECRFSSDIEVKISDNGSTGTVSVRATGCCSTCSVDVLHFIKAFKAIEKQYHKDCICWTVDTERYFVERLNSYLHRPVFILVFLISNK